MLLKTPIFSLNCLRFQTAKTSKIGICIVRKSASRISISLSCMLDDPLKFFYDQKDLINNAFERLVFVGKIAFIFLNLNKWSSFQLLWCSTLDHILQSRSRETKKTILLDRVEIFRLECV